MAVIYANLIKRGLKSIEEVPASKRDEVEAILITEESE
ncbi:CD1375 family protein [Paenibacillus radicis (ex Gao et al. 2016)]|nr:CD1375 family protein [Paenibacillus radicis (ex Gao et al. 2016)]